jgi:site-specific DNA-methyltransferase (adenine-specific)
LPEFIGNCSLYQGDSREVLKTLPDASVDALVTDPPSGIAFMNKAWDKFKGRDYFIAFLTEVLRECFRVLRPGGYAFVWALPRTSHWTARAVEDAGFEIRDIEHHVFGQGYPKNLAIGKAIDKKKGKQRKVVGESRTRLQLEDHDDTYGGWKGKERTEGGGVPVTEPATEEAGEWEGHGTAVGSTRRGTRIRRAGTSGAFGIGTQP